MTRRLWWFLGVAMLAMGQEPKPNGLDIERLTSSMTPYSQKIIKERGLLELVDSLHRRIAKLEAVKPVPLADKSTAETQAIVDEHQKTIAVLVKIVGQLTDRVIALERKP